MKITITLLDPGYLVEHDIGTGDGATTKAAFSGFQGLLAYMQPLCVHDDEAVSLMGTGRSRFRQVLAVLEAANRPMRTPDIAMVLAKDDATLSLAKWKTSIACVLSKAVERRTPGIVRVACGLYASTGKAALAVTEKKPAYAGRLERQTHTDDTEAENDTTQ